MVSIIRRVAAISAGPMSARPRGRRALSLLDLSGLLSAIVVLHRFWRLVAAAPVSGKGIPDGPHSGSAPRNRSERPRVLLDAVHGEPRLQESAAPDRTRQGHALFHDRRSQIDRWHCRPVVLQCRP